jgi:hypothetical protein
MLAIISAAAAWWLLRSGIYARDPINMLSLSLGRPPELAVRVERAIAAILIFFGCAYLMLRRL